MKNISQSKSAYIKILLNLRNGAYKNNRKQLQKDYETLKKINSINIDNIKKGKALEKLMAQALGEDYEK